MPIKRPTHSSNSVNTLSPQGIDTVNDKAADDFINRAPHQTTEPTRPIRAKRKAKTQMMMRIDEDLLEQIDERAASEGISRSAWISRTCARALKADL